MTQCARLADHCSLALRLPLTQQQQQKQTGSNLGLDCSEWLEYGGGHSTHVCAPLSPCVTITAGATAAAHSSFTHRVWRSPALSAAVRIPAAFQLSHTQQTQPQMSIVLPAMQSPGDAIMSLLILKQGSSQSSQATATTAVAAVADKENSIPVQQLTAAAPARSSSKASIVLCSPQKQRLLMGRLQASGSPGVSNRTSASPPPPGSPQQPQLQQSQQSQQLQGSPPASPTKRNPNSPPRRTIRPTPVFDSTCTPERITKQQELLSPIPSPAQLAAAASLDVPRAPTHSASVISMDVCSTASSPAHSRTPVSAPTSGATVPLLLSPQSAHAVKAVAELSNGVQRCASDVTVKLQSNGNSSSNQPPPLHPSIPSAVSAAVAPISPSGSVSPPSSAPSSAHSRSASHADFFLAEQLLRARSASRTLSASSQTSGVNGSGSGGQGVSAVGNSSSQSSSSIGSRSSLARSQSSTAPLSVSLSHGLSPRSSRVLVSSRTPSSSSAQYATSPAALGGLHCSAGRPPSGSAVKCAPHHSRVKVSVCTKPLDQILIRARGITTVHNLQSQNSCGGMAATTAAVNAAASSCAMKTYYEFP